MDFDLTPKQHHLIDLAGTLGREKFAPRAARYDAEASFPFENYDDIKVGDFINSGAFISQGINFAGVEQHNFSEIGLRQDLRLIGCAFLVVVK